MAAVSISGFLKKASECASDVLQKVGIGEAMRFPGKDGDIIYSKNNVCVHPPSTSGGAMYHVPGYLSLHCQKDETLGVTLVLQWLPNLTLESNPRSISTISPRSSPCNLDRTINKCNNDSVNNTCRNTEAGPRRRSRSSSCSSSASVINENNNEVVSVPVPVSIVTPEPAVDHATTANHVELQMRGEKLTAAVVQSDNCGGKSAGSRRPNSLQTAGGGDGLGVPSINVIPNTPGDRYGSDDERSDASPATEGEDSANEKANENESRSSSPYSSDEEEAPASPTDNEEISSGLTSLLNSFKHNFEMMESSPESFAQTHNMMLPDGLQTGESVDSNSAPALAAEVKLTNATTGNTGPCLFSVDLGRMRSLRLFYSNPECTSGQLVIANHGAQYKILYFHHGGLDKLSQIFEQWNVTVRAKSKRGDNSPSSLENTCRQFAICRPQITKPELHPEEGLYDRVSWEFWRFCTSSEGVISDNATLRKAIFFGGLDASLRKEAWPFLLHVYQWNSTREQRESIRNDLFLEYQNIRKKRLKQAMRHDCKSWQSVENTVYKDVVRTDRRNPFYEGEDNPNLETMRQILLNYAAFCSQIGYIQGMSDLLAPILAEMQNEADAFWCFAGLMQRTIFVSVPRENNMDRNLEYLRELLKLLCPDFYKHLQGLGGIALQLLFTHRWILLCFKREFREEEAFRIWEACWSNYQTDYFHLFVCVAIVATYGDDIVAQKLSNDELLLYFSSLAMHMSGDVVLKKARGLLFHFRRREQTPCTVANLCDFRNQSDTWNSGQMPTIVCVQLHGDHELCPSVTTDNS